LPQKHSHPLLREKDIRALDLIVFASDFKEALVKLPLCNRNSFSRFGIDGFVEAAEERTEVDEVCGDGAIGAEAESRKVGCTLESCRDFMLE
jgi:hypothetical protein